MSSILIKAEPYFFLAPALAILFVFLIFPLFWNTYISLHDVSLITILNQWEYIGGTNFLDLFNDPNFYMSLRISLMFVGGSVALQFGIGLLISVLLQQQVKASGILRAIFIIPWTISAVIAAFSFKFIFDDNFGILNYILNHTLSNCRSAFNKSYNI
jgi:multiple sugar transport system permease protein